MKTLIRYCNSVVPGRPGTGDGVQDKQQLVHAGHQRDLLRLACGQQPGGSAGRRARPIAGDDLEAKNLVTRLIDAFGFDVVDAGPLSEGWRFQRAMPAYCTRLTAERLQQALAAAQIGVEVPDGSWRG